MTPTSSNASGPSAPRATPHQTLYQLEHCLIQLDGIVEAVDILLEGGRDQPERAANTVITLNDIARDLIDKAQGLAGQLVKHLGGYK